MPPKSPRMEREKACGSGWAVFPLLPSGEVWRESGTSPESAHRQELGFVTKLNIMSDQTTEQTDYARRAASYWGVDGLPDILRGLVLIALAAAWLWRIYVPLQPGHGDRCLIVFIGLVIYAFVVERPVLELLKARHYVSPHGVRPTAGTKPGLLSFPGPDLAAV